MLSVADVSHHQGTIDWDMFAPSIDAVIIKAGGGDGKRKSDGAHVTLYTDPKFVRNRDEARRHNLPRWYYFFAGCAHTPQQEADHFLSVVSDVRDDEALVLDYEAEKPPPDPAEWCADFIQHIKKATGKVCVFYTNEARLLTIEWQAVVATGAPLWAAKYGINDGQPHTRPHTKPWASESAWQYTSNKRHMPGIPHCPDKAPDCLDMNQFFGDVAQFKAHGAPGSDLTEADLRTIVREEMRNVLDSKAQRVHGISSWVRYLDVVLNAMRH